MAYIKYGCLPGSIKAKWFDNFINTDMNLKTSPVTKGWQQFLRLRGRGCSGEKETKKHNTNFFVDPQSQASSLRIKSWTSRISMMRLYTKIWVTVKGQKTTSSVFTGSLKRNFESMNLISRPRTHLVFDNILHSWIKGQMCNDTGEQRSHAFLEKTGAVTCLLK